MGTFRELLGSGSLLGVSLLGPGYEPWVVMILPPGGFLTLGGILLLLSWWRLSALGICSQARILRRLATPSPSL